MDVFCVCVMCNHNNKRESADKILQLLIQRIEQEIAVSVIMLQGYNKSALF